MPSPVEQTCGTGATSGTPAWQNPGNITAEDGNDAFISSTNFPAGTVSGELRATNFGFAAAGVGVSDTIDGVTMRFKRAAQTAGQQDDTVKLFWSGAVQGLDKAVAADWPTPIAAFGWSGNYGGAADTWGSGVTAANVRDSGFGCSIKAINTRLLNPSKIQVDVVKMTIDYTEVSIGPRFVAFVMGVLPAFLHNLVLPLFARKRSVTCTAQLVEAV